MEIHKHFFKLGFHQILRSVVLSRVQLFQLHGLQSDRLLCLWDFPGKNTGAGCHFLLQEIFLTPGIEPMSPLSPALAGGFFTTEPPGKPASPITSLKQVPTSKIAFSKNMNYIGGIFKFLLPLPLPHTFPSGPYFVVMKKYY